MALTTDQVLKTADLAGRPGVRGAIEAFRRANRSSQNTSTLSRSQRDFLEAVDAMPHTPAPAPYNHPAHKSGFMPRGNAADLHAQHRAPMTMSERAWIERLPTDPTKVSWDDARRLFSLEQTLTDDDDKHLVRSIAQPIRDYHDRKEVEHKIGALSNAPRIDPPRETLGALADAITAATPELTESEALGRASTLLQEHVQKRAAERAMQRDQLERHLRSLDATVQERTAVHR